MRNFHDGVARKRPVTDSLHAFFRCDADCVSDLTHERRRKRGRRVDFVANNVVLEEDYGRFLRSLGVFWVEPPAAATDEDAIDPQYAQFFALLKEHGKSYVCEAATDLRYEDEVEGINTVPSPAVPEVSRGHKRKNTLTTLEDAAGYVPSILHCEEDREIDNVPNPATPEDSRSDKRKNWVNSDKDPGDFRSDVPSAAKPLAVDNVELDNRGPQALNSRKKFAHRNGPERPGRRKIKRKFEIESDDLDDSFDMFLNHVKLEGESYSSAHDDSPRVVYEENDEDGRSSDCEILMPESVINCRDTPFEISRMVEFVEAEDDEEDCPGSQTVSPTFRDNLMDLLRRPYNINEYNELYKEASIQKPEEGYKILRNRTKSYYKTSCCKSLLETHAGLAKKIDLFSHDHYKVLNLLRGFFYWLENLPHQGSFCPWLDPLCLAAIGCDETVAKTEM